MKDQSIEIVAQALVFAGLIWGIIKFSQEKKREFQKGFFQEQLSIFTEALDCVSNLSVYSKGTEEYKKACNDFKRIYWGKMCLVEDKEVEAGMVAVNRILNKYDESHDLVNDEQLIYELKEVGIGLAHVCRNSAMRIWKTKNILEGYNDYTWGRRKEQIKSNQINR